MRLSSMIATAALATCGTSALGADAFNFTLNSNSSTVTYNVSAGAPFTGIMTGDTTATPPTRLKHGSIRIFPLPIGVNCTSWTPTTNENIIVSGSISATGSNSNIHPSGTFKLAINTATNTASVQDLSLNLLGTSTATITASLASFRYESMCAVDPACELPFFTPITLPIGNATVSALTAQQTAGVANGVITPNGANTWDFTIPIVPVNASATATFSGAPLPVTPQVVPIAFAGTITISGNTATVTSAINVDLMPDPVTQPTDLAALPFTIPAGQPFCAGLNLLLSLTVNSTTFSTTSTANLVAAGTRVTCPCDWNNSGSVTVQDVFDYLTSYFGGAADFNRDSSTTLQDIFDFLNCFFSPPLGC